ERRLDIFSGQLPAIVKLHAFAQKKRVGFAIFGHLPTVRQVGDDGLSAVAWVTPDEIVIHAELHDRGALLMHIEMRWCGDEAVAQDSAALGLGLGCPELKPCAIKRAGDLRRQALR